MNTIAGNISNVDTTRTSQGGAFRRQLAVFRGDPIAAGHLPSKAGVRVTKIVPDSSPLRMVYNPSHPDASAEGYVAYPNVNLAVEMTDLVSAQRAYDANVAVLASEKRMGQKALEIIQK